MSYYVINPSKHWKLLTKALHTISLQIIFNQTKLWAKLWAGDDMKKLNAKQLLVLPKGKYHDGNGLYISIYSSGKGKWTFRYRINKKSREMGLGS